MPEATQQSQEDTTTQTGNGEGQGQESQQNNGNGNGNSNESWLDSLPEEARGYISDLRRESARHRTERNEARTRAQELEDRDKTDAQRAADEAARVKAENLDLLREAVAARKGVPADQALRLRGSTREELERDADDLLKLFKPSETEDERREREQREQQQRGGRDWGQGARGTRAAGEDSNSQMNNAIRRRLAGG